MATQHSKLFFFSDRLTIFSCMGGGIMFIIQSFSRNDEYTCTMYTMLKYPILLPPQSKNCTAHETIYGHKT